MIKLELVVNLIIFNLLIFFNLIEEGVNEILEEIVFVLVMGKCIEIWGFGSFFICDREECVVCNFKNGESVIFEVKIVVYFKVGKKFKECVDLV